MPSDLEKLEEKLDKIENEDLREKAGDDARLKDAENMSTGMRAGAELVGSVLAGGFIGWLLDGWLNTKPAFLIIMLLLGVITGFVNVWRTTQNIGTQIGYSELHKQEKDAKTPPDNKNKG